MKRYIFLLLLLIPLARSSAVAPTHIEVHAKPEHTTLGANVTYVASVIHSSTITNTLTLTITARLSNVTLDTLPTTACNAQNESSRVIVLCDVFSSPTVITVRTRIDGAMPRVDVTGEFDSMVAQDVQFVDGVFGVWIPGVVYTHSDE